VVWQEHRIALRAGTYIPYVYMLSSVPVDWRE
jgi:hypothetical protein